VTFRLHRKSRPGRRYLLGLGCYMGRQARLKVLLTGLNESGLKFVPDVDVGETAFGGKVAAELGRILRYRGKRRSLYRPVRCCQA
jgi:hypothetical protein